MPSIRFFLGANSPDGFFSYYEDWQTQRHKQRLFIIKGTPGNGKSGFMKSICSELEKIDMNRKKSDEERFLREEILCSADPSSLDAVYFPELKVGFADGTHPHVLEPKYPIGYDTYLPLVQFVDQERITAQKDDLIKRTNEYKSQYSNLYRILSAAKKIQDELDFITKNPETIAKINKRTAGIIRREIKKYQGKQKDSLVQKRFLSALSGDGRIVLWDTVEAMAERVYELNDNHNNGHYMLFDIFSAALNNNILIYACYNPMNPSRLAHIILPELSLAFITSCKESPYPKKPYRKIRLDACIPDEILKRYRQRLNFLRKTHQSLVSDACHILQKTKMLHDKLEDIYTPHVDFVSLKAMASAYARKISSGQE